jgi:glycosyltransferase involved in cell wall biosynthesis
MAPGGAPETDAAGATGTLRVCLIVPKLQIGGAEDQVLRLLEHLDRSRFAVSLCCLVRGDGEMEEIAGRHAESFFVLGFRWRVLPVAFARLVRFLRWGRFDVVHCHLPLADMIGRLAGRIARVPVLVTTEHGKHLWKPWWYLLLERAVARFTDLRICVSQDIADIRRRREGIPDDKLVCIPNAVDPAACRRVERGRAAVMADFGWGAADPLVLSIGRLVAAKDYPTLVEAVSSLGERFPEARCLIVGEGDRRGEIAGAIERHDVGDRLVLAGTRRDVADLLAAADVFVLSSIREGLPVSLLEAMAAGAAIVATAVGGIPDAITDGENGLLVPSGSGRLLSEALARCLEDADLRKRLGRAASEEVERRFSVTGTVRRIGTLYGELYERWKRSRG